MTTATQPVRAAHQTTVTANACQYFAEGLDQPSEMMQRYLYDALEGMRLLDELTDKIPDAPHYREWGEEGIASWNCRVYSKILEQICHGPPTVPDRVFNAIRKHTNLEPLNQPGTEAVFMAFQVIEEALCNANAESWKIRGKLMTDIDELILSIQHNLYMNCSCMDVIGERDLKLLVGQFNLRSA